MTALFKKLNFKNHSTIVAINCPTSFDVELNEMASISKISKTAIETDFAMIFAVKQIDVDNNVKAIFPKLIGDVVLWLCYPKGTSKKYKCEFNRDTGWEVLGKIGMEPVRQVAIDEDWSALRFRKVENIKTITRAESMAITVEAKNRTSQKRI